MNEGFIFLHRKLLEWEWYSDLKVTRLFIHLLLKANHKPNKWQGIEVQRGEHITSFAKLSHDTKLSVKEIRTAISKLKRTNEVTTKSTSQNTIIQLVNYDKYQARANEGQAEGQTKGKQGANEGQQTIMINKENNENMSSEGTQFFNSPTPNDTNKIVTNWIENAFETEKANKAWLDWIEHKINKSGSFNRVEQRHSYDSLRELSTVAGVFSENNVAKLIATAIRKGWKDFYLTEEMEAKKRKAEMP